MWSIKKQWIVLGHGILLFGAGFAELTHAAAVLADTFVLANGDRITGKIIKNSAVTIDNTGVMAGSGKAVFANSGKK